MQIPWESLLAVPIDESKKLQWAQECIDYLKKNPKETMTYISSGDTIIMVTRVDKDQYTIEDLQPRRWAFYDQSDLIDNSADDTCSCSLTNLLKKGCQCGGN